MSIVNKNQTNLVNTTPTSLLVKQQKLTPVNLKTNRIWQTIYFIRVRFSNFFKKEGTHPATHLSLKLREQIVKTEFGEEFLGKLKEAKANNKSFEASSYNELIYRLSSTIDKTEKTALTFLFKNYELDAEQTVKILQGAHILLVDNGTFHQIFKESSSQRISSHPSSEGYAYSFQGAAVRELLFSKISKDMAQGRLHEKYSEELKTTIAIQEINFGDIDELSWFQLEKNPIVDFKSFLGHAVDYLRYKFTGKQQGPYGSSHHVDTTPVIITPK